MFVCVYAWIRVCINMRIHRHDSFICDIHTWHNQFVRGMTLSNVTWLIRAWHDSSILNDSFVYDMTLCDMTHSYVTRLTHDQYGSLSHMWHASFMCPIHTWYASFIPDMTFSHVTQFIRMSGLWRVLTRARTHTHIHIHTYTHTRTHIYTHNTQTPYTHLWHICLSSRRWVCVCVRVCVCCESISACGITHSYVWSRTSPHTRTHAHM